MNTRSLVADPLFAAVAAPLAAQSKPTIEQFIAPATRRSSSRRRRPIASRGSRTSAGKRNVYTAAAPDFKPVRLTTFLERRRRRSCPSSSISDDGIDRRVRARQRAESRRLGRESDAAIRTARERAVWAAQTDGSGAWRLGRRRRTPALLARRQARRVREGRPDLSRRRDGARARPSETAASSRSSRRGAATRNPRWSPDGSKLAFVSDARRSPLHRRLRREDARRSTSSRRAWTSTRARRGRPTASASRSFVGPGTPFGQQAQHGDGGIGNPPGPDARRAAARGGRGGGGGGGRGRRGAARARRSVSRRVPRRLHARRSWSVDARRLRRRRDRRGARVLAQPAGRSRRSRTSTRSRGPGKSRDLPAGAGGVGSRSTRCSRRRRHERRRSS